MMIYSYLFGAVFIGAGVLFITGKALTWIKGWQQTPQQEKDKIRIKPLCRNIGTMLVLAGLGFVAAGYSAVFREMMFRWVMVGWMVLCGLDLFYIEKSKCYIITDEQQKNKANIRMK